MELLALVGKKQKAEWLGKVMEVLLEEPSCEMPGFWQARSQYHAPDVDGVVYVRGNDYQAGEFVKVKITDVDSYDLFAEPIVIADK
jgi:ribosomal protein S12 methylthiotransferase